MTHLMKNKRSQLHSEHSQWRILTKLRKGQSPKQIAEEEHVPLAVVAKVTAKFDGGE